MQNLTAIAASGLVIPESAGAIAELSAFGLVAWLVLHTFKHTIPRLADAQKEARVEDREANERIVRESREAMERMTARFLDALAEKDRIHAEEVSLIRETHEARLDAQRQAQEKDNAALIGELKEMRREMINFGLMLNGVTTSPAKAAR